MHVNVVVLAIICSNTKSKYCQYNIILYTVSFVWVLDNSGVSSIIPCLTVRIMQMLYTQHHSKQYCTTTLMEIKVWMLQEGYMKPPFHMQGSEMQWSSSAVYVII